MIFWKRMQLHNVFVLCVLAYQFATAAGASGVDDGNEERSPNRGTTFKMNGTIHTNGSLTKTLRKHKDKLPYLKRLAKNAMELRSEYNVKKKLKNNGNRGQQGGSTQNPRLDSRRRAVLDKDEEFASESGFESTGLSNGRNEFSGRDSEEINISRSATSFTGASSVAGKSHMTRKIKLGLTNPTSSYSGESDMIEESVGAHSSAFSHSLAMDPGSMARRNSRKGGYAGSFNFSISTSKRVR
jgi:hypothetical protein